MGSVLASAILSKAATTLLDATPTRWLDAEKLIYLNDGQRLTVLYKPDSNVVIDVYQLVPGTKQRIPDGSNAYQDLSGNTLKEGINLLELFKNMGITGEVPGDAIDPVDLQELNAFNSSWHSDTPDAAVQNYVLDERYPDNFFVYPPQPKMLWDKAASVFRSGTYAWAAAGTNTIANATGKLQITYVNTATGAAVNLKSAADLNADLTVGQSYTLSCKAKYTGGIAGVKLDIVNELAVSVVSSAALSTSEITYFLTFTATHATNMAFQLSGMAAANVVTIDDIVLSLTPGFVEGAWSALPDDIATTANVINLSDRYQTALYYYVVHRCYAKDAALSPFNASRAIEFWNLFVTELGRLDLIKKGVSPNVKQPNPSPSLT